MSFFTIVMGSFIGYSYWLKVKNKRQAQNQQAIPKDSWHQMMEMISQYSSGTSYDWDVIKRDFKVEDPSLVIGSGNTADSVQTSYSQRQELIGQYFLEHLSDYGSLDDVKHVSELGGMLNYHYAVQGEDHQFTWPYRNDYIKSLICELDNDFLPIAVEFLTAFAFVTRSANGSWNIYAYVGQESLINAPNSNDVVARWTYQKTMLQALKPVSALICDLQTQGAASLRHRIESRLQKDEVFRSKFLNSISIDWNRMSEWKPTHQELVNNQKVNIENPIPLKFNYVKRSTLPVLNLQRDYKFDVGVLNRLQMSPEDIKQYGNKFSEFQDAVLERYNNIWALYDEDNQRVAQADYEKKVAVIEATLSIGSSVEESELQNFLGMVNDYLADSSIHDDQRLNKLRNELMSRLGIHDSIVTVNNADSFSQKLINARNDESNFIDILTKVNPYAFEAIVGALFEEKTGYEFLKTQSSGDQGLDVILHRGDDRIGIQVKRYTDTVGNAAVQQAIAGSKVYNCQTIYVATTSSFTKSAIELAKTWQVHLVDGDGLFGLFKQFLNSQRLLNQFDSIVSQYTS